MKASSGPGSRASSSASDAPAANSEIDRERDEVIKRMHATPPKPHAVVKRRPIPQPVNQQPKHRTNKKRKPKEG